MSDETTADDAGIDGGDAAEGAEDEESLEAREASSAARAMSSSCRTEDAASYAVTRLVVDDSELEVGFL